MRVNVPPNEIATLVAENNTDTDKAVKTAYKALKGKNLVSGKERITFDFLSQMHPGWLPLKRIKDTVHMVQKDEASLLQLADACAMVIRYCLEERTDAQPFIDILSSSQSEKVHMHGQMKDPGRPAGFNILTFPDPSRLARMPLRRDDDA